MTDPVQQYLKAREDLLKEKERLEQRLREIEAALGETVTTTPAPAAGPVPKKKGRPRGSGGRGRGKNVISLREAIRRVTWERPLTRKEILDEVLNLGYKFSTKNPINSINQVLYASKEFVNLGGKFMPKDSPKVGEFSAEKEK